MNSESKKVRIEMENVAVPEIRIGEEKDCEETPAAGGKKQNTRIDYSGAVPEIVIVEES